MTCCVYREEPEVSKPEPVVFKNKKEAIDAFKALLKDKVNNTQ